MPAGTEGICEWITDHGGTHGIDFAETFSIVQAWVAQQPPAGYTFIPTFNETFGVIQYWLSNYAGGHTYTGCGT